MDHLVHRTKRYDGMAVPSHRSGLHTGKSVVRPDSIASSTPDSGALILVSDLRCTLENCLMNRIVSVPRKFFRSLDARAVRR